MARNRFTIGTGGEVAVATSTAGKTILLVTAPANQMLSVLGFGVSFDGTASTAAAIQAAVMISTASTTSTGATTVVGRRSRVGGPAIQSSGLAVLNTEPSSGIILREYEIHPQSGYERAFEPGEIEVDGGSRVQIRLIADGPVNARAWFDIEE